VTPVSSSSPRLRAVDVSAGYPSGGGVQLAVAGVSLDLVPGRVVGLAGESGSGKSTLAYSLLGFPAGGLRLSGGAISFDEADAGGWADVWRSRGLWGAHLAYMPQDAARSLNPALDIRTHFVEALRRHRRLSPQEAVTATVEWLDRVEIPAPAEALRKYQHQFSGGQQQRLALALALCMEPDVLILDEPTTGLDVVIQRGVTRLIAQLVRERRIATLYVSHNLALLASISDTLAVMYGGQIVEVGPVDEVYARPRHPYTRALLAAVPGLEPGARPHGIPGMARSRPRTDLCGFVDRCPWQAAVCLRPIPLVEVGPGHQARCVRVAELGVAAGRQMREEERLRGAQSAAGRSVLEVRDLRCVFRRPRSQEVTVAVAGVSLRVEPGRTLGIAGESGSGKSTLLKAIVGLVRQESGSILLGGTPLQPLAGQRPASARKAIQIVFQNPDATLNPRQTVEQSLVRPLRLFEPRLGRSQRRQRTQEMLDRMRLPSSILSRLPNRLSGGQRQRVAIARALLARPQVLLCDEITSALDVSVQAAILELLTELRASMGLAMIFVTHDLGVLAAVASEVMVIRDGAVCEAGPVEQVLRAPRDPYSRLLIDAIPQPHTAEAAIITRVPGRRPAQREGSK
jgi:peptide/nickel transport system ATP-binding protein